MRRGAVCVLEYGWGCVALFLLLAAGKLAWAADISLPGTSNSQAGSVEAESEAPWAEEQPWSEKPWRLEKDSASKSKDGDEAELESPWDSNEEYRSGPWDNSANDEMSSGRTPEPPQPPTPATPSKPPQKPVVVKDRTDGRWEKGLDSVRRTEGRRFRSEGLWDKSMTLPGRAELRWTRPQAEDRTEVRWAQSTGQTAEEDRTEGRWDAERESAADRAAAEEEPALEKTEKIRQRVGGRWLEQERIGERTERLTAKIGQRWDEAQQRWGQFASGESEEAASGANEGEEEEEGESLGENQEDMGEKQEGTGEKQTSKGEISRETSGEDGDKATGDNGQGSQKKGDGADSEKKIKGEQEIAAEKEKEEEGSSLKRDMAAIRARLDRQLEAYRKQRAARRLDADQRAFIGKDGVPVLTNRPEKYRRKASQYKEITIVYEPIVVAGRYRTSHAYDYKLSDLHELVSTYARKYGVNQSLIYAMIQVESAFNPAAVSPAGARGLMQLMPGTAAEMGVTDIFDVAQNIAGGTQYIAKMLQIFDNDLKLALAAYNAGPETVKKYGAIPPYKETQGYVRRVLLYYRGFGQAGAPRVSLAKHDTPKADYVPKTDKDENRYTILFHSGLTQVADKVVDDGSYYYVQYDGRVSRVRKEFVKEIVDPA